MLASPAGVSVTATSRLVPLPTSVLLYSVVAVNAYVGSLVGSLYPTGAIALFAAVCLMIRPAFSSGKTPLTASATFKVTLACCLSRLTVALPSKSDFTDMLPQQTGLLVSIVLDVAFAMSCKSEASFSLRSFTFVTKWTVVVPAGILLMVTWYFPVSFWVSSGSLAIPIYVLPSP